MLLLAVPFALFFAVASLRRAPTRARTIFAGVAVLLAALAVQTGLRGHSYEEGSHLRDAVVRRDHTATVISYGRGFDRRLLVNGYGMTVLTPLTKVMAHLPLASLDHEPKRALVIAFGMGTTFRSLLSWGIEATAVELVPSVIDAFGYYHADADTIRRLPLAHIVVDDGRRYLARTSERFDLITLDPPPPVETAGSSLLYAEEFYELARTRLAEGGIVHQWFPDGAFVEPAIRQAVLRAITRGFPHVRIFGSLHGQGLHVLCSLQPIDVPDAETFVARLPEAARRDLMEWEPPGASIQRFVEQQILAKEIPIERLLVEREGPSIRDDRPFNEYFALRRLRRGLDF
jgi:predicted membrane-bound spermidine synthase